MKFTVIREKWYRGQGAEESALLRGDGKMCCVGFLAKACGVEDFSTLNGPAKARSSLRPSESRKMPNLNYAGLYLTNDTRKITDEERELQLTSLLASEGVKVEFV